MKVIKIFAITIVVIVGVLAFLNPSYTRFKEFSTDVSSTKRKTLCKRTFNGLIYSVYERKVVSVNEDGEYEYSEPEHFYGFCLNFFPKRQ